MTHTTTRQLNGPTVRALREALGIGLRELAMRTEIDPGYLTRLEAGQRQPSPAVLTRLARALGYSIEVISYPALVREPVPA